MNLKLHLFDSLIKPVLNFGAEIWGPAMLLQKYITTDHACERWHRRVLKGMVGVSPSTTSNILMEELDRTPLCFDWLKLSLNFWNKIVVREDICNLSLSESFSASTGWVHDLRLALRKLGSSHTLDSMDVVNVEMIMHEVIESWRYKHDPPPLSFREVSDDCRDGFKRVRYYKWFADDNVDNARMLPFTAALDLPDQIRIVAQFRMGSHWLNSETMRMTEGKHKPRSERKCTLCKFSKPEDEMHIF